MVMSFHRRRHFGPKWEAYLRGKNALNKAWAELNTAEDRTSSIARDLAPRPARRPNIDPTD